MTDTTTSDNEFGWPWTLRWPAGGGAPALAFAPERLWQPINTGWTFGNLTINTDNSSAPQIEQQVLNRHSYGRQIGRLMDAVEVLIAAVPKAKSAEGVQDFLDLAAEVHAIKEAGRETRLGRLRGELEALKVQDPQAWKSLVGR